MLLCASLKSNYVLFAEINTWHFTNLQDLNACCNCYDFSMLHFLSQSYQYTIEALVLHDSWPLTESESLLVQELKEMRKNEIKGRLI